MEERLIQEFVHRASTDEQLREELKRDPDGVIFDLTHNGWVGAVKDVIPEKIRERSERKPDRAQPSNEA